MEEKDGNCCNSGQEYAIRPVAEALRMPTWGWTRPVTRTMLDLYVIRGAPTTNTEGLPYPVHHMHFHHQETVPEMRET